MDPFVPYDVDRAIRDRLIRGSELTTTPNDVFKLLNSQRIKKSDLINHFFNRFGLDKNTKVHYIKLTTKSWKNFIYQKESREYVYQKVDRALEKLHSFHDMIFYDLPLLMVIKLHFSGNGQKISTQLSKYVKYIRSEYIRKVGMPKMVNEAIDKNIE